MTSPNLSPAERATASPLDFQAYCDFASQLAAECGKLAAAGFGRHTAERKSDGSLVTETDERVDRLISGRITAAYPDHAILSEEQSTAYDPAYAFTWVVDPIDGTTNFAQGLPIWGVSIALLYRGMPVVGVLDFPLLREQYVAVRGQGVLRAGKPLATAPNQVADDEHFLMKCTRTDRAYKLATPLKSRIMGSAAYHLCKVADGSALAGIEMAPKVWDLAAAWLILVEAGGVIAAADGDTIFPLAAEARDYKSRSITTFAAANPALFEHLRTCATQRSR